MGIILAIALEIEHATFAGFSPFSFAISLNVSSAIRLVIYLARYFQNSLNNSLVNYSSNYWKIPFRIPSVNTSEVPLGIIFIPRIRNGRRKSERNNLKQRSSQRFLSKNVPKAKTFASKQHQNCWRNLKKSSKFLKAFLKKNEKKIVEDLPEGIA